MQNSFFTEIRSERGNYSVHFADCADYLSQVLQNENVVIIVDENVANLHADRLSGYLSKLPNLRIKPSEESKTWSGVESVIRFFMEMGCHRNSRAIVIGGGIIQDIAAFSCHTFFRGIKWEFFPTTLLAMADSCIGAKSGLNFADSKNIIGVFENPQKIIIDTRFIETLSEQDVYSGLGEIAKLALISGFKAFDTLEKQWSYPVKQSAFEYLIRDALLTKKRFIEEDEYDHGIRRILNYGHTFGHAIESVSDFTIPHGVAVVIGMDLINFLANKMGLMESEVYLKINKRLSSWFLIEKKLSVVQVDEIIKKVSYDKKRTSKGINFAILKSPGQHTLELVRIDGQLNDVVQSYFRCGTSLIELKE